MATPTAAVKNKDIAIAGFDAHKADPPLPQWPYDQNDSRSDVAPDDVWALWRDAKPPVLYDPPQFKYGPCSALSITCCYYHRPGPPCGCDCCSCCCIPLMNQICLLPCGEKKYVQITDPDDWFYEMLTAPMDPDCPEYLRGVFWMQDNPGSETICTFQQCAWVNNRVAFQDTRYNYCHDASNIGGFAGAAYQLSKYMTRIEIDTTRAGKWINLGGYSWMYAVQPEDVFYDASGYQVDIGPGDFMRVSYLDQGIDPQFVADQDMCQHTLMFQYLVRKIAYLDESGTLVKTPAYDELADRASGESKKTCCGEDGCGFFSLQEVPENDWQTVAISTADPEEYDVGDEEDRALHMGGSTLRDFQLNAPRQQEME